MMRTIKVHVPNAKHIETNERKSNEIHAFILDAGINAYTHTHTFSTSNGLK